MRLFEEKTEYIASGTEVDLHGHQLTYEALLQLRDMVNEAPKAKPSFINHDSSVVPFAKLSSARVKGSPEHAELLMTSIPFTSTGDSCELDDGTKLEEMETVGCDKPLDTGYGGFQGADVNGSLRLHVDLNDLADRDNFVNDFKTNGGQGIQVTQSTRKGMVVEAILLLIIGKIGGKILDKGVDKAATVVINSSKSVWTNAFEIFKRNKRTDTETNIRQQIEISTFEPCVVLHCSDDDDGMSSAFEDTILRSMLEKAQECKDKVRASTVHFKYLDGRWQIHYVETASGKVYVSQTASAELVQKKEEFLKYLEENNLTGGFSINIESNELDLDSRQSN